MKPFKRMKWDSMTMELVGMVCILLVSFWLFGHFDVFEALVVFTNAHEEWELDEVIPTAMVMVVCLLAFSLRRWTESVKSNRELTEALRRLKRLEGILHMCMSCKEIRDANGSWHQLEKYIGDHSDAKFSHSMCKKCAKRLYPEAYGESTPTSDGPDANQQP